MGHFLSSLAWQGLELSSRKVRQRLKWFDYYNSRSHNAWLTCHHFDISLQTFYRWKRCYNLRQLRQPTYSTELVEAVLKLREQYPRWGKDKLVVLLHDEGFICSASTVGRILNRLKEHGALKELIPNHISVRKSQHQRPYAIRKPKEYLASKPGDIIEVDTLDVRPLPGITLKHFTGHEEPTTSQHQTTSQMRQSNKRRYYYC